MPPPVCGGTPGLGENARALDWEWAASGATAHRRPGIPADLRPPARRAALPGGYILRTIGQASRRLFQQHSKKARARGFARLDQPEHGLLRTSVAIVLATSISVGTPFRRATGGSAKDRGGASSTARSVVVGHGVAVVSTASCGLLSQPESALRALWGSCRFARGFDDGVHGLRLLAT